MLRNATELIGLRAEARDGAAGATIGFYFDGTDWTVRYIVLQSGGLLRRRDTLISTVSLRPPPAGGREMGIDLTCEQVKRAPATDFKTPISREHEHKVVRYFGWPAYWEAYSSSAPVSIRMPSTPKGTVVEEKQAAAAPLLSTRQLTGMALVAGGSRTGELCDFVIDDAAWRVRFLVIRTGGALPGKKVLLFPSLVEGLSGEDNELYTSVSADLILSAPGYEPSIPVTREYENRLFDHYGVAARDRWY